MKRIQITGIVLFLIAAFATTGLAMERHPSGVFHSYTLPSPQCSDIVRGGILPPEQASYLRAGDFANSIESVATGVSPFAPSAIPPEWKAVATAWKERETARSVNRTMSMAGGYPMAGMAYTGYPGADSGEGICSSTLIYRAFLDYRKKTGQPELKPVYPYQVRNAYVELAARYERVARRAREIETTIVQAERMGARDCSPSELSIAWAELRIAVWQAAENGYDIGKTEAAFANAQTAAVNLIAKHQLASTQRNICN